jgi:hypothetical protein
MYVNGNAINVNSLNRAFIIEDDVNREKRDIMRHTHVPAWFGIYNPVRAVFGTGCNLCHKMFAGGVQAFGNGEMVGNNCGMVKTNSAI